MRNAARRALRLSLSWPAHGKVDSRALSCRAARNRLAACGVRDHRRAGNPRCRSGRTALHAAWARRTIVGDIESAGGTVGEWSGHRRSGIDTRGRAISLASVSQTLRDVLREASQVFRDERSGASAHCDHARVSIRLTREQAFRGWENRRHSAKLR